MSLSLILLHLSRMVDHILNFESLFGVKSGVSLAEESRLRREDVLLLNQVVVIINIYTIYDKLFLLTWHFLLDCGVTLVTGSAKSGLDNLGFFLEINLVFANPDHILFHFVSWHRWL